MMTIQITQSGNTRREVVEQAQFVPHCRYARCGREFLTIDPDKLYCCDKHRVYAYRYGERMQSFRA